MARATTAAVVTTLAVLVGACGDAGGPPNASAPVEASRPAPTPTPAAQAGATLLPLAAPSARADGAAAFVRARGGWTPALYLCDGVDGPQVAAVSRTTLWTFAKPGMDMTTRTITLGGEDAGAGSVFRDLLDDDRTIGAVRSLNPGMLGPAEATTLPTLSSIRIGDRETRCRWLPRARLLIVAPERSAIVTQEADGSFTYRSFDHDKPGDVTEGGERGTSSVPTVEVRGGRLVKGAAGSESYEFAAPPWTYRVTASARVATPGASVAVMKDGREVSRAEAVAYEMAAARIE